MNTPLTTLDIGSWSLINYQYYFFLISNNYTVLNYIIHINHIFYFILILVYNNLTYHFTHLRVLLTILQSNNTLKSLRVEIKNIDVIDSMGTSLQNMFIPNQTIEYLKIECYMYMIVISNGTYLSSLTTGLSHNTSLQELSIFIPVSDTNNEQIKTFFNFISQKNFLTELKLHFTKDWYFFYDDMKQASLFYEQVLPLVTNMLELHATSVYSK